MPAIIMLLVLLAVAVVVKLFDDDIRASQYGKIIVVWVTLCDLFLLFSYVIYKVILGG